MTQRPRKHAGTGNRATGSPRLIAALWAFLLIGVVVAVLFAPRKTPPPPASAITYDDGASRPAHRERAASVFEETDDSSTDNALPSLPLPPESRRAVITGTVTQATTGNSVSGARVQAFSASHMDDADSSDSPTAQLTSTVPVGYSCVSKQDGTYELPVAVDADYVVLAAAEGFLPGERKSIQIPANERRIVCDLTLSKGATVSGRVTETKTQKPAPNIPVAIWCADKSVSHSVRTDVEGRYSRSGLEEGAYTVSLDLSNTAYLASERIPSREVTIPAPEAEVKNVDFVVNPGGTVWGYVYGTDKKTPMPGTDAFLCSSESIISQVANIAAQRAQPIHDNSNESGYYELVGVPLDKEWRVQALPKQMAPQLSDPFILTEKARIVRVDLFIRKGTTVYGWVLSTDGLPIPDADVLCLPGYSQLASPMDSAKAVRETKTDEKGAFVLDGLPIGEYQILANKKGYKFALMGEPIRPDGLQDIRGVQVRLTPVNAGEHTVYGTVRDSFGQPVSDVSISLMYLSGLSISVDDFQTTTDAQGFYRFDGLEDAGIFLQVSRDGYSHRTIDKVNLDQPTDIVLDTKAELSGRVIVKETGAAVPHARVRALPQDTSTDLFNIASSLDSGTSTDADGRFTLKLDPGDYTLEAFAKDCAPGKLSVSVTPGERSEGIEIPVSEEGSSVRGRVISSDGRSIAGASIRIGRSALSYAGLLDMAQEMGVRQVVESGSAGEFEIKHLAAGTYRLEARAEGYAIGSAGPLTFGEGQNLSGVTVVMGKGGALQGYVSVDGRLKSGAMVVLAGNGVKEMSGTDQNGQYVIRNVPAGNYLASVILLDELANGGGFRPLHRDIEIRDGQTTTCNFCDGDGSQTAQGTLVTGICTPPPPTGTHGVAILLIPSADPAQALNLLNPMQWFGEGASDVAAYIQGYGQIGSDGSFQIENAPKGDFLLQVYYLRTSDILRRDVQPVYSNVVHISGDEQMNIQISIKEKD